MSRSTFRRNIAIASISLMTLSGGEFVQADVTITQFGSWSGRNDFYITGAPLALDTNADDSVDTLVPSASFVISSSLVPTGATLLNAYLYWGGSFTNAGSPDTSVRLTVPGGSPTTISADVTHLSDAGAASFDVSLSRADVTSLIGTVTGTYTVDNYTGLIGTNSAESASTALLLVYADPAAPHRTVMAQDGLVTMVTSTQTISFSGFDVAASPTGSLAYYTMDGDSTGVGGTEQVGVTGNLGGLSLVLSDSLNPSTNPMNHTINTTSPSQTGTIGVDIDRYDISSALSLHDSSLDVLYSANSDKWWLGVNVVSVNSTPEPTSLGLLTLGLFLALTKRRRHG